MKLITFLWRVVIFMQKDGCFSLTCLQVYMLKKICDIIQIEKIFPVALLWLSFTTMFPLLHANASRDVLVNCLSICFIYNVLAFHFSRKAVNVKYILLILAIAPFVQLSLCLFIVIVLSSYALFYFRASFNEMGREALQIITLKKGYIFLKSPQVKLNIMM